MLNGIAMRKVAEIWRQVKNLEQNNETENILHDLEQLCKISYDVLLMPETNADEVAAKASAVMEDGKKKFGEWDTLERKTDEHSYYHTILMYRLKEDVYDEQ